MADDHSRPVPPVASPRAAHRGLDWLNLYVANIQTGFGPFIAIYLISRHWTQTDIGVALSIGTVTTMVSQIPAGALVDVFRSKALIAGLSVSAFAVAALVFAIWPVQLFVYLAEVLHGFSSATLAPALAAISLGLVGTSGMAWRLSRNTRFSALGSAVGAALMGAIGSLVSPRSVFLLTAFLTIPAFFALRPLRRRRLQAQATDANVSVRKPERHSTARIREVLGNRWLLVLCLCALTFTFANAPLVPLAAARLTESIGQYASIVIGVCIVLPQVIVLFASSWVGRLADAWGRKPILVVGCCMVPLHGLALMASGSPYVVVASELFDGIAAVCFGIMIPLITSDLAGASGHYNLALGTVGFAIGVGASVAMPVAGEIVDRFGYPTAFAFLATTSVIAIVVALVMRETRPSDVAVEASTGASEIP